MPKKIRVTKDIQISETETITVTEQEELYCCIYADTNNAIEAYQQAFNVKRTTARNHNHKLFARDDIQKLIKYYYDRSRKVIEYTKNETFTFEYKVSRATIKDMLDEDGNLLPLNEIPDYALACCEIMIKEKQEHAQGSIKFKKEKKFNNSNCDMVIKFGYGRQQKAQDFLNNMLFSNDIDKEANKSKQLVIENK